MKIESDYTLGRRSIFWQKALIMGMSLAALVSSYPECAHAKKEKPEIRLQTSPGDYYIKAEMPVPYPPEVVFRTCTDYEAIDENISLFRVSRILKRQGNTVRLYQTHVVKILFFEYETESVLEINETPFTGLSFKEIKGSYKIHQGSWTLVPENGGQSTLIKYEVQAIPRSYVPRWLVVYFMKRDVRKAFEELYHWIITEPKHPELLSKVAGQ